MPELADRVKSMGVEDAFIVLEKAKAMERAGTRVIHFEIGEPDFDTPGNIKEAAIKALREGFTHYTPADGIYELREAIAEKAGEKRDIDIKPEEVVVTVGGKMAIFSAVFTFINPGDEVILPSPAYPAYAAAVELAGGSIVKVPLLEEKGFSFRPEDIESKVSKRTKAIIVNSPSNPTGGVIDKSDLEALAEIAKKYDLVVLSDEIYEDIVFDGEKHSSIASIPGMKERTVIISGFSKSYAMTGWRLGYAIASANVADKIKRIQLNACSCPVSFAQKGAIEAILNGMESARSMAREYERRRDVIIDGLNRIPGFKCLKPKGAFYAFPNVKELGLSSKVLAGRILEEAAVALLPGTSFGMEGEGYLRLSFATSVENIKEGLERIRGFVEEKLT